MIEPAKYLSIVSACEAYLERYGDNYLGVGWTKKQEDADARYRVMLDLITSDGCTKIKLLDFGCGASHLYEHIRTRHLDYIEYSGLDLSDKFLTLSQNKFPAVRYYHQDILVDHRELPLFDYVVLNGVFNSKCNLSFEDMFAYFRNVISLVFTKARIGIAFNVMSKHVDWERDDLFHLPLDVLASFLTENLSRHFRIRHDYGLYEYTTYVYKQAVGPDAI